LKIEYVKWFRHGLVKKCFEDDLDDEERRTYHERAAKFFESLMEEKEGEKLNRQNNDNMSIEEEGREERYSIAISCAYHLHMAGGKYHEKSFTYNKGLADYASKIGDLNIAERCYKRAIADAEYLGKVKDNMDCLYYMTTNVYDVWARYEESLSNYQSLLKYYISANDSRMRAALLNNIAMMDGKKGEYEQALKLYNQSLEISRQFGHSQIIANTLNNIAMIQNDKGEYEQALKLYNQSLEITRGMGDEQGLAYTLNNIADIHRKKGEYEQALKLYNQSLEIKRQIGDKQGVAYTLNNIAVLHDNKGEYEQALKLYNQSLEISRQLGDEYMIGMALNNIALVLLKKEEYEESLSHVLQAYKILERLDTRPQLQRSRNILDNIEGKLGSEAYQRLVEKVEKSQLS